MADSDSHDIDGAAAVDLLSEGTDRGDIIGFGSYYWVIRNGKYTFDVSDHWV